MEALLYAQKMTAKAAAVNIKGSFILFFTLSNKKAYGSRG